LRATESAREQVDPAERMPWEEGRWEGREPAGAREKAAYL